MEAKAAISWVIPVRRETSGAVRFRADSLRRQQPVKGHDQDVVLEPLQAPRADDAQDRQRAAAAPAPAVAVAVEPCRHLPRVGEVVPTVRLDRERDPGGARSRRCRDPRDRDTAANGEVATPPRGAGQARGAPRSPSVPLCDCERRVGPSGGHRQRGRPFDQRRGSERAGPGARGDHGDSGGDHGSGSVGACAAHTPVLLSARKASPHDGGAPSPHVEMRIGCLWRPLRTVSRAGCAVALSLSLSLSALEPRGHPIFVADGSSCAGR
jgi:hypothetical protein